MSGEFWECGVYRGGTAALLARVLESGEQPGSRRLRLFDTFTGLPEPDPQRDLHRKGDFSDTSVERVTAVVMGGWPGEGS